MNKEKCNIDAWLSLVERCVRDAEVVGSNPVASIPWQGHQARENNGFVATKRQHLEIHQMLSFFIG